jgi:spore coat protein U-like protein
MLSRTRFVALAALSGVVLALAASPASAQSASTTFQVTATVIRNCTIAAANLAFGNYDVLSALPTNAQSNLTVACTKNVTATIGLDLGQNPAAGNRQMAFGAERLLYTLWRDAARTLTWGNAAPNLYTYVSAGRAPATVIVYGQVPAGADVAAGAYADQIVATINF